MANYYPKGHMISGSHYWRKERSQGYRYNYVYKILNLYRELTGTCTQRDLTGAVAMFEKTRNLSHCERETNVPRKAIQT